MAKQSRHAGSPLETFTRAMFTKIITALARTLRDEALSIAQVAALHILDQQGTSRVSDLAEQLGMSASAASRLTDVLVQRGLLARAEDPDDRRAKALTVTADGRAFVARIGEDRVQVVLATLETLPKQFVEAMQANFQRFFGRP